MRRTKQWSRVNELAMSLGLLAGAVSSDGACCPPARRPVRARLRCNRKRRPDRLLPPVLRSSSGADASLLQPGAEGQAAYVYINPNVQWSNYKKVMLKPVEFWDNPDTSVSPDDQKMLTSYFYNSLQTNLQKNFTIVDQPGPGVMTVAVAIINADGGHARLAIGFSGNSAGSHIELRAILATGHAAFAGSAEAAFKGTDSSSGTIAGGVGRQAHWRYGREPMLRRSSGATPKPRWIIGRCISLSARSRLERARRQQQASLRRATSLSDASRPTQRLLAGTWTRWHIDGRQAS